MLLNITHIRQYMKYGFYFSLFLLVACSTGKDIKVPEYLNTNSLPQQEALTPSKNYPDGKMIDHLKIHEHQLWTDLLVKYVDSTGKVDYVGFQKDSLALNTYLQQLAKHTVNDGWTYNQKKAYWINAYNAFTVKLIVDNYPVKSIKDLGGGIYKVNTPWDIKFIKLGEKTYDLNNIEHGILRKDFSDPRIHAAVNCASISCPKLRQEAYRADQLEAQLTDQMRAFVNNPEKNTLSKKDIEISSLFKWFSGDFTEEGDIIDFLNSYGDIKIDKDAKINYKDYNWDLNE
ncbi:Protein of unknown function, DUF547 [Lishizhenia tianjinensis]|uniref:DUF547 domain-containing protein n=1 Tax=Lishizhenia tianjinensis TaxID=477690 RepID=A0A1I7BFH8_9FLAO|nr:DUF547 domain-containing protein [Lishizhenia tianjinensis]SFT85924.1 Protein of unknown function, DUF547 [Lishizhenia tianjinensis]